MKIFKIKFIQLEVVNLEISNGITEENYNSLGYKFKLL